MMIIDIRGFPIRTRGSTYLSQNKCYKYEDNHWNYLQWNIFGLFQTIEDVNCNTPKNRLTYGMGNHIPTVYIVDDDAALCKALRWLLESIDLRVETFHSAMDFLRNYNPNWNGCLLIDVRMPDMSGLQLQEQLIIKGNLLPIIMLSGHGDISMAVRAMKAGAIDFITKPFNEQVMLEQIQKGLAINKNHEYKREVAKLHSKLSEREQQVFSCIVEGKLNKLIADELHLSPKTIELHRSHVMKKMGAKSVADLVKMYLLLNQTSNLPT
jgi:two-component system, LuxR family, response regulator FixJ